MEDSQEKLSPSSSISSSFSLPIPDPLSTDAELWLTVEQRTQEILCIIQPNIVSDKRRREIVNYVRRLIKGNFGTEVRRFLLPLL